MTNENKAQKAIYVLPKVQYGKTRYFPMCETSRRFCAMKKGETLNASDLQLLIDVGLKIMGVPDQTEPYEINVK